MYSPVSYIFLCTLVCIGNYNYCVGILNTFLLFLGILNIFYYIFAKGKSNFDSAEKCENNADISNEAKSLNCGLGPLLHQHFVYLGCKYSVVSVFLHRLVHVRIQRGDRGSRPPLKNKGFLAIQVRIP